MEYNVQIILKLTDETKSLPDLVALFPLRPNVAVERGSRNQEKVIPRSSYISFHSYAKHWSSPIEDHWENFAAMLKKNETVLSDIADAAQMKITIVVDHRGRFPSLYLPPALISFAATVGAALDIDVYEN